MLQRILRSKALLQMRSVQRTNFVQRRMLVAPPKAGQVLMERRSDRELPEIDNPGWRWARTIPIFLAVLISSCLAIFNYQKSSSSVVASSLYALRTSPTAREYLGDDIYFAHQMPWIWGEMNQLHGRIDIQFSVKGSRNQATMRFTSHRPTRIGMFVTTEWSLTTKEKKRIDLLDAGDPFEGLDLDAEEVKSVGRGSYAPSLSQ
ncbi:cytochrome oxidase complex assembly protein 1-domain-containing protein [Calycina marina]|uniref:Cytochrome oxidase complex assembly protein 1-domain-containing protein n=1 Tax=Calycina marina TaxID=1763456 RepID=A0A9P7ZAL6_9HELO|nr:cytochrome oxidase complex assembly protein 1-domain-containing protein [Calycina marina]